jgi:hypothetical protein
MRAGLLVLSCAAAALVASCTLLPTHEQAPDAVAARVGTALERSGLGADALLIPDNILRNDARAAPPAAPPIVREILGHPLAAGDAETLFYRTVPGALRRLVDEASAPPRRDGPPVALSALLDPYVAELARAQRRVRAAARGAPVDPRAILADLAHDLPSEQHIAAVASGFDTAELDRGIGIFLSATARFIAALRASRDRIVFPQRPVRFDSPIGVIAVGTPGDDAHAADAALIIDPGGNDTYERGPVSGGAVSVIVDLGGDDRYRGSDLVVHGLSAIIDLAGDDRYTMTGPGLGAAIAGASLIVDVAGNDVYDADLFAQGAAASGLGVLVDLEGNDRYRVRAGGQGFAMAGGVGLLWDRAGDDVYAAGGLPDPFERGAGLSWAQGAAFGFRTALGGGVGILRDESGDDRYEAEMFAQGAGYYYALGLLWDGHGRDVYRAVRYAQGNGVHEAVGLLRDDAGDDRYALRVGVGQGMGLDLAVGVLFDGGGGDDYRAPAYAQGSATANGIGIVFDADGADHWHASGDRHVWGFAEPLRGLPSVGVVAYGDGGSVFDRDGTAVPAPAPSTRDDPVAPAASLPARAGCPAAAPAPPDDAAPLAELLRRLAPGVAAGAIDASAFARVRARLSRGLRAGMDALPTGDFEVMFSFGETLRCALALASDFEAQAMWNDLEAVLRDEPRTPFVGAIIGALAQRPAPPAQMRRLLAVLDRHAACGVRVGALRLREAAAADDASRAELPPAAEEALRSPCWQLQSAALGVLRRRGAAPAADAGMPSFLRPAIPRP